MEEAFASNKEFSNVLEEAKFYRNTIFTDMEEIRATADSIESLVGEKYWPYPTYGELLFSVV